MMGLLEEAAVLFNSGLIKDSVALHFFGYYAIDCWNSKHIWKGLDRDVHWKLLGDFVVQMQKTAQKPFDRNDFRF